MAWTHSLLDSAKSRHEFTAYSTVPNHGMNSQPTWQCQIMAWTHSLLDSAKSRHELTAYLTVPNHGMNSQPTWQCQIMAWTHSILDSAKSWHELTAYSTVPNHGMNLQPTRQCQITAWTHSLLDSAKPRHELNLLDSAKLQGPEECVHPKCGPCWGGPPCRMQTHSCHRDLYNHWNSIWQKGCWGLGHPNGPIFLITRVEV